MDLVIFICAVQMRGFFARAFSERVQEYPGRDDRRVCSQLCQYAHAQYVRMQTYYRLGPIQPRNSLEMASQS